MIVNLIRARLTQEDCNGGAIFDNLDTDLWKGIPVILDILNKALSDEIIQLILVQAAP